MCAYCNMGDHTFRYDPPWMPNQFPSWPGTIPMPREQRPHYQPWDIERLREFEDVMRRVKTLEEKLGCESEPNKADYISLLEKRIAFLEGKPGALA